MPVSRLSALWTAAKARLRRPGAGARRCTAHDTGLWGEDQATAFLKRAGYRILARRARPTRHDELDIVARDAEAIVFVEVKTRASDSFAPPAAAVEARKRHALCRAAAQALRRLGYPPLVYRFDIVEVVGTPGCTPRINHIEDAFPFESRYRFPVGSRTQEGRKGRRDVRPGVPGNRELRKAGMGAAM